MPVFGGERTVRASNQQVLLLGGVDAFVSNFGDGVNTKTLYQLSRCVDNARRLVENEAM